MGLERYDVGHRLRVIARARRRPGRPRAQLAFPGLGARILEHLTELGYTQAVFIDEREYVRQTFYKWTANEQTPGFKSLGRLGGRRFVVLERRLNFSEGTMDLTIREPRTTEDADAMDARWD